MHRDFIATADVNAADAAIDRIAARSQAIRRVGAEGLPRYGC